MNCNTNTLHQDDEPFFLSGSVGFDPSMTERESALDVIDACSNSSHPLAITLGAALYQAVNGKGEDRHGAGRNYLDQPWVEITRDHGAGFLTGQASKKIKELVANMDRWSVEQTRNEAFGAINYLAMFVTFLDLRDALLNGEIHDPDLAVKLGVHAFDVIDSERREHDEHDEPQPEVPFYLDAIFGPLGFVFPTND